MRPTDQTEYIVQAIREGASMYEEDARRFLAEHDAHVRAEALREAAQSLEDSVPPAIAGPFTERERALLGTARTLRRLAASPSPAAGDKQPETATEYGIRVPGRDRPIAVTHSRPEAEDTHLHLAAQETDVALVQRTVTYGQWTEAV
ncbi:hypothetical protein [Streptomyces pacificus]|uniref:Uncharacterized protein n=1 Tax=Streptomyces pacificus TaxID=2705029 RepID=A0A6A0AQ32_9ACTN|nr:hypothetical protein [Streptomyces pacificus]GFH34351.1 hypothetical protein SCWH03_05650 [Streptomyces pacificus]